MGQYIQQGERFIFETVLNLKDTGVEVSIPKDTDNVDGLDFLTGKTLNYVNSMAFKGAVRAHVDGDVPNMILDIDTATAYDFGYLVYFFELACGISGHLLGVNAFNQPSVEAYKKNMFALLGKPGYEQRRAELDEALRSF